MQIPKTAKWHHRKFIKKVKNPHKDQNVHLTNRNSKIKAKTCTNFHNSRNYNYYNKKNKRYLIGRLMRKHI